MKFNKEQIDGTADRLSEEYNLDPKRVREVFNRMIEFNVAISILSEFEVALLTNGDENAPKILRLFEEENLAQNNKRSSLLLYLNEKAVPFYSLDELSEILLLFKYYLEDNESHILKTGFPLKDFEESLWLNIALANTNFVKIPFIQPLGSINIKEARINPILKLVGYNTENQFIWVVEPAKEGAFLKFDINDEMKRPIAGKEGFLRFVFCGPGLWWRKGYIVDEKNISFTVCNYEEAKIIEGLDPEEACRYEELREKVYNAKKEILVILSDAAKKRNHRSLWENCLKVLTGYFSAQEIDLLFKVDKELHTLQCGRVGEIKTKRAGSLSPVRNGSLPDLFHIIGYIEKELVIGTMDRTYNRLKPLPESTSRSLYYSNVLSPVRDKIDSILDEHLYLETQEDNFWYDYKRRVEKAILEDFKQEVKHTFTFTANVNRRDAAKLERLFEDIKKELSTAENDPESFINSKLVESKIQEDYDYLFRQEGDHWEIAFEGIRKPILNYKGLKYIAYLLKNPFKQYNALEFEQIVNGYNKPSKRRGFELDDNPQQESGIEVIDDETKKIFNERIKELKKDLETATKNGNHNNINEIKKEIKEIKKHLRKSTDKFGNSRKVEDPLEDARKRISNNIKNAKKHIYSIHPQLYLFLDRTIKYREGFKYIPDKNPPPDWKF